MKTEFFYCCLTSVDIAQIVPVGRWRAAQRLSGADEDDLFSEARVVVILLELFAFVQLL